MFSIQRLESIAALVIVPIVYGFLELKFGMGGFVSVAMGAYLIRRASWLSMVPTLLFIAGSMYAWLLQAKMLGVIFMVVLSVITASTTGTTGTHSAPDSSSLSSSSLSSSSLSPSVLSSSDDTGSSSRSTASCAPAPGPSPSQVIRQIHVLLTQHDPSSIRSLPAMLKQYEGRELRLLIELRDEYGVSTTKDFVSTSPTTAATAATSSCGTADGSYLQSDTSATKHHLQHQLQSTSKADIIEEQRRLIQTRIDARIAKESVQT